MNGRNKRWAEQRWDKLQRKIRDRDRAQQRAVAQERIKRDEKLLKNTGQGGDSHAA